MQPTPGNAVAQYDPAAVTGLEDFGVEDLKLPRLTINHETGAFKDSLSGVEYPELSIIPLGVVKQRVLWHPAVNDDKDVQPLCKSTDFQTGYPTMGKQNPNDNFPWRASGWNPGDFQPNAEGRLVLPCGSCRLKDWGSHPMDGRKTWCSEQHAIVLLYGEPGTEEPGMIALFTAQRSSINASKAFFGGIMRKNAPAFSVRAKAVLTPQVRGKNKYYVPAFIEVGPSNQENWPGYADSFVSVRSFITQPPRLRDDSNAVNPQAVGQSNVIQAQPGFGNNTWAPGAPAPQAQQYAPPQYQPPVQQPPVPQYAPPPPPMAPPAPPAPPVQQAAPAPVAPPVQAAVVTPPPVTGSTPARDDAGADDDLPF